MVGYVGITAIALHKKKSPQLYKHTKNHIFLRFSGLHFWHKTILQNISKNYESTTSKSYQSKKLQYVSHLAAEPRWGGEVSRESSFVCVSIWLLLTCRVCNKDGGETAKLTVSAVVTELSC